MKKLNNKGFAISTMLYGILTIVVIILMMLLGIMRSSYNKENAATEEIYHYLNKCLSKQIALEQCYKTYNEDPTDIKSCKEEYEAYTACTGKTGNTDLNKRFLNTTIVEKASDPKNLIHSDPLATNRYIYIGSNPNNYVKIGSSEGRIISVEAAGTIKVLLTNGVSEVFDELETTQSANGVGRWENSTLHNTFNNKFNSFDDKTIFTRGRFYMAVVYNNDSTFDAMNKIRSNTDSTESYFGLPSLEDYLKASSNIKEGSSPYCNLTDTTSYSLADAMNNCRNNNWMNTGVCAWTSTGYGGIDEFTTYSASSVINKPVKTKCSGYMVVYLASNVTITATGEGSKANPYVIE